MKGLLRGTLVSLVTLALAGCAYMGFHGPSVQSFPGVHRGMTEDRQCLQCHDPDRVSAPTTPHASFKGCLKCHNDTVQTTE